MLYRIKYLLGTLVGLFSVVYLLFGIVGWVNGSLAPADLITCFVLASVHIAAGVWLLLASLHRYRIEQRKMEYVMQHLIHLRSGRIRVDDLAQVAKISSDDAREYLEQRSKHDVSVVMKSQSGEDVYFLGQQFWNN